MYGGDSSTRQILLLWTARTPRTPSVAVTSVADVLPTPTQEKTSIFIENMHGPMHVASDFRRQERVPEGLQNVMHGRVLREENRLFLGE